MLGLKGVNEKFVVEGAGATLHSRETSEETGLALKEGFLAIGPELFRKVEQGEELWGI